MNLSEPTKPALDSSWYILATIGHKIDLSCFKVINNAENRNRIAWNHWAATGLTCEQKSQLIELGLEQDDLSPLDGVDYSLLRFAITDRKFGSVPTPADQINFSVINFDDEISFDRYIFARRIDFSHAIFKRKASFRNAVFLEEAVFNDAIFEAEADFNSAIFCDHACFNSTIFKGYADFNLARFSHKVSFDDAEFEQQAYFHATNFRTRVFFRKTKFWKESEFINTKFSANTVFRRAHFDSSVPDFRGAEMHHATEWDHADWPPPPRDEGEAQQQVYRYERLKQEMENLKKHEDELKFFGKELRARRSLMLKYSGDWFLNWLYELISDYCNSIFKPLCGIVVVFIVGVFFLSQTPSFKGEILSQTPSFKGEK
jgi:hypothetical protein